MFYFFKNQNRSNKKQENELNTTILRGIKSYSNFLFFFFNEVHTPQIFFFCGVGTPPYPVNINKEGKFLKRNRTV